MRGPLNFNLIKKFFLSSPRILSPISQRLTAERPLPVDSQAVRSLELGSTSVTITLLPFLLLLVSSAQSDLSGMFTGPSEALQFFWRDEGEPSPVLLQNRLEAEVGAARARQSLHRLRYRIHGHSTAAARSYGRRRAGLVDAFGNRAGVALQRLRFLQDQSFRSLGYSAEVQRVFCEINFRWRVKTFSGGKNFLTALVVLHNILQAASVGSQKARGGLA